MGGKKGKKAGKGAAKGKAKAGGKGQAAAAGGKQKGGAAADSGGGSSAAAEVLQVEQLAVKLVGWHPELEQGIGEGLAGLRGGGGRGACGAAKGHLLAPALAAAVVWALPVACMHASVHTLAGCCSDACQLPSLPGAADDCSNMYSQRPNTAACGPLLLSAQCLLYSSLACPACCCRPGGGGPAHSAGGAAAASSRGSLRSRAACGAHSRCRAAQAC